MEAVTGIVERFSIGPGHSQMGPGSKSGAIYYLLVNGNPLIQLFKRGVWEDRFHTVALTIPGDTVSVDVKNGSGDISTFKNLTLESRLGEFKSDRL